MTAKDELIRRVANLNPEAGTIGPGMLRSLVEDARAILGETPNTREQTMTRKFFKPGHEAISGLRVSAALVSHRYDGGTRGKVHDELAGESFPARWVVDREERDGGHWAIDWENDEPQHTAGGQQ